MEEDSTCAAKLCIIEEGRLTYPQWISCESCNEWHHFIGLNVKNMSFVIFVNCPFVLSMLAYICIYDNVVIQLHVQTDFNDYYSISLNIHT